MAGRTSTGRARMPSTKSVTLLGIRHHGPGSAHSLVRALDELRPDCILVEGPTDGNELIEWVGNSELQPPLALLLYNPEKPASAVYYPFAEFSPEWQAIRFGLQNGTPVHFIDLPQSHQLAIRDEKMIPEVAAIQITDPDLHRADPIRWLAETAGYSDSERWWENQVEQRRNSGLEMFTGIQEMMSALRAEVEKDAGGNVSDGLDYEKEREAYMRQSIRKAQVDGYQNIAVVCGAWHTPALGDLSDERLDVDLLKNLPKVKTAAAWVPWSFGRLSWESGYGAGIESPGWYEALWTAAADGIQATDITIHWMTRVAHLLRGEDLPASSAHVIEAVRLAETLAALRGQPVPGLPEMNEAIRAVFCFGDDLPLALIHEKLIINERLGRVPEDVPLTPLQSDLARQQKHLRLQPDASQRLLDLDLRNAIDLERSYLLHRLNILEIPWGVPQESGKKSGTFHEFWNLAWKPELAIKVVEASQWGNSVQEAANKKIEDAAGGSSIDLPALTRWINRALLADLPASISALLTRLDAEAAMANDTGQLMDALPDLAQALRYGNVRQTDTNMIARVVDGLVVRICIGLPAACSSLNDDAAREMYDRLMRVHDAITLLQLDPLTSAWQETLIGLADQAGLHGLLAGRACTLLLDKGAINSDETSRRLGLALSMANEPSHAADWVEGLLKDRGTLLVHEDSLWQVMNEWVAGLASDAFTQLLPLLRRTFSSFSEPERRLIGERAKKGDSVRSSVNESSGDWDEEQAKVMLWVISRLLGITQTDRPGSE